MRFKYETERDKTIRLIQWHQWFAWFPVTIAPGEGAWLEWVERALVDSDEVRYKYRALTKPERDGIDLKM